MTGRKVWKEKKYIIAIVILTIFAGIRLLVGREGDSKGEAGFFAKVWALEMKGQMQRSFSLLWDYAGEDRRTEQEVKLWQQWLIGEVPVYAYYLQNQQEVTKESPMAELILTKEGSDEDRKEISEEELDYDENALHIEAEVLKELENENARFMEAEEKRRTEEPALEEEMQQEEEILPQETAGFQRALYPAYTYDWSEQWGYEEIVSNFYAIDSTTALKEEYARLEKLLYREMAIDKETDDEGPQILIYHTHSQEAFADSIPGDASTTIVGAGEKLARLLREEYGFRVLHHTGEYDVENRDYAYSNSLSAIETLLAENPSIEVVIDLHRDEMKEGKKLVMDLQGRPTARFMFFNGMSYIRDKGEISYLENPYIEENLAMSFQAQVAANEYYPGIARRIYLKAYRYNLHLRAKSMLIELGAQTNTVEEIMNACDPLAHIIAIVLDENL